MIIEDLEKAIKQKKCEIDDLFELHEDNLMKDKLIKSLENKISQQER